MIWTPYPCRAQVVDDARAHLAPEQVVEVVLDVARNAANKIAVALGADAAAVTDGVELFTTDADGNLTVVGGRSSVAWVAWARSSTAPIAPSGAGRCSAIPIAVIYKYFDDQGNYLAAIITYYAFIAIFPLLLLGLLDPRLLPRRATPTSQQDLLDSALAQFPIIGDQLGQPEGLQGSTTVVVIGWPGRPLRCARASGRRCRTRSTSPGRCRATAGPTRSCCG